MTDFRTLEQDRKTTARMALFAVVITLLLPILAVPQQVEATVEFGDCKIITSAAGLVINRIDGNCNYRDIIENYFNPDCIADNSQCSPEEKNALAHLNLACNYGGGINCPQGATTDDKRGLETAGRTMDCAAADNWGALLNPVCWARTLSVVIGSLLISATAWLLSVAGLAFNWLVDHTVVQFGLLYTQIKPAVEIVWTVFRDVANILIVGLFVFIAISLIVGIKEYGQRRMIARVLIVAVLINFSLLFTKIIIDASNFVALQFYNAASLPQGENTGITFGDYSQSGISGRFIELMGVTSLSHTVNAIQKNSFGTEGEAYTDANGLRAFVLGLFGATLLLAAAVVLLYGVYLLMVRAILIIFLMITSALAFASYLIPKYSTEGVGEQYGWKAWWGALLRAAAFGPLLMMFLWATLFIGTQVKSTQGTLGDLLTNTTSAANLQALFSYLLILGLLLASIKLASSFSSTVGGFNIAAAFAKYPLIPGSNFLAWAGRFGIGMPAYRRANKLEGEARDTHKQALRSEFAALYTKDDQFAALKRKEAAALREQALKKQQSAARMSKLADSSFNLMQTKAAKALGIGAAEKEAGYATRVKEAAKEIAKEASKVEPSSKEMAELRAEAQRNIREQRETSQQQLEEQRRNAERSAETISESIRASQQTAKETADRTEDVLRSALTEAAKNASVGGNAEYIAAMEKANKRKEEYERTVAAASASGTEERRRSELRHEAERIRAAQRLALEQGAEIAARIDSNIAAPLQEFSAARKEVENISEQLQKAQEPVKTAAAAVDAHKEETKQLIEKVADTQGKALKSYSELIAKHQAGLGERLFGATEDFAAAARKNVEGDKKNRRLKDLADQIGKATKETKETKE